MERNGILIIMIDRACENSRVAQASSKRLYSVDPVSRYVDSCKVDVPAVVRTEGSG